MDLHTFYEVQLALAEGDMSTAWIYGVSGVHPWFMALLDDRAAQEVWGSDTSTLICSSLMPAGKATGTEGGFRLSGHWRYASCCDHCDWALLGALVDAGDGGPPEGRVFLVPRRDYQSVDTWQVSGLQATGSWDVIVDDVFVPAYRTQSMLDNFLLKGPGQALNTVEPLSIAVRPDFRPRDLDRGAGGVAGHAQRAAGLQQDPRDARGRSLGGKPVRPAALRRNGGGDRRDEEHLASQFRQSARLCQARRDAAARGALAIQVSIDRSHRALHVAWPRASSRRPGQPAFPRICRLAEFSPI